MKKIVVMLLLLLLINACVTTTSISETDLEEPSPVLPTQMVENNLTEENQQTSNSNQRSYVTFWFDDGLESVYYLAYPQLELRGWKAVLAVISDREVAEEKFLPEGTAVMTWEQVTELYTHGWEISSHSRSHPRLNEEENKFLLASEIIGSRNDFYQRGYIVPSFTFPYGQNGLDQGQKYITQNYLYWRSSMEEINPIPSWRHVTAYALTTDMSEERIEELIEETELSNSWLVFILHGIVEEPINEWQHTREQFDMLLDAVERSSLQVVLPQHIFSTFGYAEILEPVISTNYSNQYESIGKDDFLEDGLPLSIPSLGIDSNMEIVCEEENGVYDFSILHESPVWVCPDTSSYLSNIGEFGASIILGHRQWGVTPKIFAKLNKLKVNEYVLVGDEELSFEVIQIMEIEPEELWPTIAKYHTNGILQEESYLILITCTPYGTDWQRLLVITRRK